MADERTNPAKRPVPIPHLHPRTGKLPQMNAQTRRDEERRARLHRDTPPGARGVA